MFALWSYDLLSVCFQAWKTVNSLHSSSKQINVGLKSLKKIGLSPKYKHSHKCHTVDAHCEIHFQDKWWKPMGIWFSPILHTHCPLFLGLFFFFLSLGWGGYFVIYFISCPIKSLPFSHGQSALMSASFLCIERIIFRQNKA